MSSFEKHLLNGIPRAEAAAFFIRIKQASLPAEDLEILKQAEREVRAQGMSTPAMGAAGAAAARPTALPPAGMGQNMAASPPPALPPTGMGQNKVGAATGEEREQTNYAARLEKERLTKGERRTGSLGRLAGTVGGTGAGGAAGLGAGLAASDVARDAGLSEKARAAIIAGTTAAGALGGGWLGRRAGGSVGSGIGHALDKRRFKKEQEAKGQDKAASAFKLALEQMGLEPQIDPQQLLQQPALAQAPQAQGIEPQLDPATQQYLAVQQQAEEQSSLQEAAYLRQQLEAARSQQQALEQQAQAAQQQAEQQTQAQAMHDQQLQQYQAQVADSTQKAVAAQDQVLQQQQAAAAMRMAYQQLRGTLLQAASTDPPSLTPGQPGADAAQMAMSQQAGSGGPAPQEGAAGQAATPGTPPGSPAPMGEQTVSAPSGGTEPMFGNAEPTSQVGQKEPQGDAKTPGKEVLSFARPFVGSPKTASLAEHLAPILGRLPYAVGGAGIGAGLGALESHAADPEALQMRIQELEAKPKRGYGDTMNLAQLKGREVISRFAKEHPAAMMGANALGGAATGYMMGPEVVSAGKRVAERVPRIGKSLREIFTGKEVP
jgi:hypothetical protein